jgi:LCP family protein required for cell wall assembly
MTPADPPPPSPTRPPSNGDALDAPSTPISGVPVPGRGAPLGDQTGESFFGSSLPEAAAGASAADLLSPDAGAPLTRKERRQARSASGKGGGGGPGGGKGSQKGEKPKRTWLDRVLLGGIVVVALALVAMGTGYAYVQFRFNQVTKVTVKHLKKAPVGQPFNVLLIGSDSRVGQSAADAAHFGNQSNAGGQRSDVVKIVHIVPATGQVSVLSIPRDTVITVSGDTSQIGKYNRINATYNIGPDQLVQTIEANFGIPIEHVVQVNFVGLRGAVDAIGGIKLNFPYPAKDAYTGLNVTQPGCQLVNGGYSLALARSRHYQYYRNGYWQYDGTSDFGRIQRQNAFLRAVINQAESKYNPLTLNAFVGSVVQGVTVDSTFTVSDLISLARQFHSFSSSALATSTLPTYSRDSSEFGYLGSVLYVQQPQALQVISQFLGQVPDAALTAPPGPYGVVSTTTTTSTLPRYSSPGGSTPSTSTSSSTTTTIETDFDPTPC